MYQRYPGIDESINNFITSSNIDKMMNCTAAEPLDLMDAVYGDYVDGIESKVFGPGSDLTVASLIK